MNILSLKWFAFIEASNTRVISWWIFNDAGRKCFIQRLRDSVTGPLRPINRFMISGRVDSFANSIFIIRNKVIRVRPCALKMLLLFRSNLQDCVRVYKVTKWNELNINSAIARKLIELVFLKHMVYVISIVNRNRFILK